MRSSGQVAQYRISVAITKLAGARNRTPLIQCAACSGCDRRNPASDTAVIE